MILKTKTYQYSNEEVILDFQNDLVLYMEIINNNEAFFNYASKFLDNVNFSCDCMYHYNEIINISKILMSNVFGVKMEDLDDFIKNTPHKPNFLFNMFKIIINIADNRSCFIRFWSNNKKLINSILKEKNKNIYSILSNFLSIIEELERSHSEKNFSENGSKTSSSWKTCEKIFNKYNFIHKKKLNNRKK
jgi:hypothetical protein